LTDVAEQAVMMVDCYEWQIIETSLVADRSVLDMVLVLRCQHDALVSNLCTVCNNMIL